MLTLPPLEFTEEDNPRTLDILAGFNLLQTLSETTKSHHPHGIEFAVTDNGYTVKFSNTGFQRSRTEEFDISDEQNEQNYQILVDTFRVLYAITSPESDATITDMRQEKEEWVMYILVLNTDINLDEYINRKRGQILDNARQTDDHTYIRDLI